MTQSIEKRIASIRPLIKTYNNNKIEIRAIHLITTANKIVFNKLMKQKTHTTHLNVLHDS